MCIVGSELRWKALKIFARKRYKIDLKEILLIEWGKKTPNFKKPTTASVKEEKCFSLLTDKITLDLEASSKVGVCVFFFFFF